MHLELEQRIVNTMKGNPPFVRMRYTLWWCGVGHGLWVNSLYMYHSAVGLDSNTKMATLWEIYLVWCPYSRKTNKFEKLEGCSFLQMEPWNIQRFVLRLPIDIEIDIGFDVTRMLHECQIEMTLMLSATRISMLFHREVASILSVIRKLSNLHSNITT